MGVGALTVGAIECVLASCPTAEISILDYSKTRETYQLTVQGRSIHVSLIPMRFSKKFYLTNNIARLLTTSALMKVLPSRKLRKVLTDRNACLKHLDETDIVASLAGGDSFSDIYGIGRLLYVSLPQILALLLRKKLVLLPQTLGPFRTTLSRILARSILARADVVYSRDTAGLETLKSLLGVKELSSKFAFCHDVAFLLEPVAPGQVNVVGIGSVESSCRPVAGLNVSGLLHIGGYTRDNMFGLRSNYADLMRTIIEFLVETAGMDVLLVPHVFGSASNHESDVSACEKVYTQLKDRFPGRLGMLTGRYNQNEIKYVIGKCDFFTGARMHACIAAVSQGVPAVCLAYSDKFIGVMQTLGVESVVADLRTLGIDEILDVIRNTLNDKAAIKTRLTLRMSEVKSNLRGLFTTLTRNEWIRAGCLGERNDLVPPSNV